MKLLLWLAMIQGGGACCAAGERRVGPCEWNCAGRCDFHPDFTVKVGCAADAAPSSGCRQGWGRALCSCTDACSSSGSGQLYLPQPLSAPSPPPLLASGGSTTEGEAAGGRASLNAMDMERSSVVAVPFGRVDPEVPVQPGPPGTLQAAVDAAAPRATLVLEDGLYTGKSGSVLSISKSITIRAKNPGRAVLDGETKWRVVEISGGNVALEGLNITGGKIGKTTGEDSVRLAASNPVA